MIQTWRQIQEDGGVGGVEGFQDYNTSQPQISLQATVAGGSVDQQGEGDLTQKPGRV